MSTQISGNNYQIILLSDGMFPQGDFHGTFSICLFECLQTKTYSFNIYVTSGLNIGNKI